MLDAVVRELAGLPEDASPLVPALLAWNALEDSPSWEVAVVVLLLGAMALETVLSWLLDVPSSEELCPAWLVAPEVSGAEVPEEASVDVAPEVSEDVPPEPAAEDAGASEDAVPWEDVVPWEEDPAREDVPARDEDVTAPELLLVLPPGPASSEPPPVLPHAALPNANTVHIKAVWNCLDGCMKVSQVAETLSRN